MTVAAASALADRDFAALRELRSLYGLTKAWVLARLKDGTLRAKRVKGIVLVDLRSVREMIANSPDWSER